PFIPFTPSFNNKPLDDIQMSCLGCSSNGGLSNRELICHCPLKELQVSTLGCFHPCMSNKTSRSIIRPLEYLLLRFYGLKGIEILVRGWIVPAEVGKPIGHAR